MTHIVLLDLDETLAVEEPAAVAAFAATAAFAAAQRELDADALALGARSRARELWYASPNHPFASRIGISSWEGLWCRFEGDSPELLALREWAPDYRREAWALALGDQGVDDAELAEELGERFGRERRDRQEAFPDSAAVLIALRESHLLGLITNGASCLQREKLESSGLAGHFDVVVVSGEFGVAKPDPSIFIHALQKLGGETADATMVGDNLVNDVGGATAAGLSAVWVNRAGEPRPADAPEVREITTLHELPALMA